MPVIKLRSSHREAIQEKDSFKSAFRSRTELPTELSAGFENVAESVTLAEIALNEAQQALDAACNQIEFIKSEKAQIIENNDFSKVDYINTLIKESNIELAKCLEMVAEANQMAEDVQLVVMSSTELTSEEKASFIEQLKLIELGPKESDESDDVVTPEEENTTEPEEIVEPVNVTESVLLAQTALNEAQQALNKLYVQMDVVKSEKAKIIESNNVDRVDYLNALIEEHNAELARCQEMVAKANQLADDAQFAVIGSTELTPEEKVNLIKQLNSIELDSELSAIKGVSVETEKSATLDDLANIILHTIGDLAQSIPKFISPIYEIITQVVVGVFGAFGLYIPHAIVGGIKLISKIPTFLSLGKEFFETAVVTVKSAIDALQNLVPTVIKGFEFLYQAVSKGFPFNELFSNVNKGISAFINDFADYLDARTKLIDEMKSSDYPTNGIYEFVGNFVELITNGLLNIVDAANKAIAAAVDSSQEVSLWYEENFAPVWNDFQNAIASLAKGISQLITIPITAIVEFLTTFVLVANERALHKLKELLGETIDLILDSVADILHKLASIVDDGYDTHTVIENLVQEIQEDTAVDSVQRSEEFNSIDETVALDNSDDYLVMQTEENLDDLLSDDNGDIDLDTLLLADNNAEIDAQLYDNSIELDQPAHYALDELDNSLLSVAA